MVQLRRMRHCHVMTVMSALWFVIPVRTQVSFDSGTDSQGWGPWTTWSSCSISCEPEFTTRSRSCDISSNSNSFPSAGTLPSADTRLCHGTEKQYKVCNKNTNKNNCNGRKTDPRKKECDNQKHVPYRGRRYHWDPFINPHNKCEVTCKSRRYGFYTGLGRPVKDGVTCDTADKSSDISHVCLHGKCQAVGCDGIVGSGTKKDHCGVCGGDNDSCRIIAGIFTRRHLKYGYNQITRIPKGSCHINITELARSRNYLVLNYGNGTGVINSNRALMKRPGRYPAAGTTFIYNKFRGEHCPGECLYAEGPLIDDIEIQMLYYRRNTGIKYMFTVPKNMIESVMQGFKPSSPMRHQGQNAPRQQPLGNYGNNDTAAGGQQRPTDNQRRINYNQQPKYVEPDNINQERKGYQALESGSYRVRSSSSPKTHSTQDAINRFRDGYAKDKNTYTTNKVDINTKADDIQRVASRDRNYNIPKGTKHVNSNGQTGNHVNGVPQAGSQYYSYPSRTGGQVYNRQYQQTRRQYQSYDRNVVQSTRTKLTIPNTIDEVNFHWTISGFTECSKSCGGGRQDTNVVCMKRKSNVKVTDENCDPAKKNIQTIVCNKSPCPPDWEGGTWSVCSRTCGSGLQTRRVQCRQRFSENMTIPVSASRCDFSSRPVTSRSCEVIPCAEWKTTNWTKCSVECGIGEMTRSVECLNTEDATVPDSQCAGVEPDNSKSCDMGTCAKGWFLTAWSEKCSSECGAGHHTRTVYCSAEDGSPLPEAKCGQKPRTHKPCRKNRPCGGFWFEGPWTKCTATCGSAVQTRDVVCMKKLNTDLFAVVKSVNCKEHRKPPTEQPCPQLPECPSEWYMTKWTECSKSCGTGIKTRDLKCIDASMTPSSQCAVEDKPTLRRSCNTQDCDLPQLDEDPSCKDNWSQCHLVVQSRLCPYKYYKKQCCHSCALHHLKHKQQRERAHHISTS